MPSILLNDAVDGDVLWPAPDAGQFIRVLGLDLTADKQTVVALKSNTTTKWDTYAMNDPNSLGGITINVDQNRTIDCAPGEALKLGATNTAKIKGSVQIVVKGKPNAALLAGQ